MQYATTPARRCHSAPAKTGPFYFRNNRHSRTPTGIPAPAGIQRSATHPVILAKAGIPAFPISTVIPTIYHPSFRHPTRHSGESRNLAPPLYSTFRRSNDQPAKPPEKFAIFNDTTSLRNAHQSCTLAISKSGNPAPRGRRPPKANPAAQVHGDPSDCKPNQAKSIGRNNRQPSRNRVQDNTAKTVGIATIVGSGTHSALFHGGVSGHAAGVPTALCRSIQWAGAWKTRTRNLASKIALAVAPTA